MPEKKKVEPPPKLPLYHLAVCPGCGATMDCRGCKRRCLRCGYYEGCDAGGWA